MELKREEDDKRSVEKRGWTKITFIEKKEREFSRRMHHSPKY